MSDLGDGTYKNPVIYADYSDVDVIRVDEEYYLTASSFNCTPGLPLLVSRDLVNWSFVGQTLENVPDARYASVQHGAGILAPSIREHRGTFYIFAPTPDEAHVSGLRVAFSEGGLCRFAFGAKQGPLSALSETFQAVPGRWIGAKLGLFSLCERPFSVPAHADFDYLRFGAPGAEAPPG